MLIDSFYYDPYMIDKNVIELGFNTAIHYDTCMWTCSMGRLFAHFLDTLHFWYLCHINFQYFTNLIFRIPSNLKLEESFNIHQNFFKK